MARRAVTRANEAPEVAEAEGDTAE